MKLFINRIVNFLFIASLAIGIVSCVSTDGTTTTVISVIDSPLANPLASLSPSTHFNWEMYNKQIVTLDIADRYSNQYDYVLQIFDEKPLTGVSPIAVGTARGDSPLTCSLDINQRGTLLYVRQIDPAGRIEIYSFVKPVADSFTLSLYSDASDDTLIEPVFTEEEQAILDDEDEASTQALASGDEVFTQAVTRANTNAAVSFDAPSKPDDLVSATSYPSTATESFPDSQWEFSGDYVIKEGQTQTFDGDYTIGAKSGSTIYVAGTLEYGSLLTLQKTTIYVLPTGKIVGGDIRIQGKSNLYIARGGTAEMETINLYNPTQLVVDGTVEADKIDGVSQNSILYIGSSGVVNVATEVVNNFSYIYLDADQDEGIGATLTCENIDLNLHKTVFVVKNLAQLKVSETIFSRSPLYNEGYVSTNDYDAGKVGFVYNSCAMIVTNELVDVKALYMHNASLSGPFDEASGELTAIPKATLKNNYIYLYDGSYIYISDLDQKKLTTQGFVTDGTEEASLIRLDKCTKDSRAASSLSGAIKLWAPTKYQSYFEITDGASAFSEAQDVPYTLETCSGLVVEPIPAEPDEPEFINGELKGHYTVNFEDKWPQFGDYDLNDIVYHIGSVTTVQTPTGIINEVTVNMELLAVGATFHLALGLQIPSLNASDIESATVSSLGQVGAGADDLGAMELDGSKDIEQAGATDPVVIPLFYDAHAFLTGIVPSSDSPRTMIGTGGTPYTPREVTLHITFAAGANIDASKLSLDNFDFFLYRPSDPFAIEGKRVEIHLMDYLPTINAINAYMGTSNDASVLESGKTYTSADHFPWAIRVMDNTKETTSDEETTAAQVPWGWVLEGKSINVAYEGFADWVNTGSDSDTGWSTAE